MLDKNDTEVGAKLSTNSIDNKNDYEITKLKQECQDIRDKLNHYAEICENVSIGCVKLNGSGCIEEANILATEILGKERRNLINRHFDLLIDGEYRAKWQQITEVSKCFERLPHCDLKLSERIDKNIFIRVTCLRNNAKPDSLFITFTDITAQKKAEEELKLAAVAFETQEAIAVTDEYRSILKVNHAFTRLTGYTAEEVVDLTPAFLRSGLQTPQFYDDMWKSAAIEGYWQGEHWEKRKNGDIYQALVTLSAVYDENKNITHYVRFSRDITAEKQAEKVLLDSHLELENRVATTLDEMKKVKKETDEVNTALNILLKRRETEKTDAQLVLLQEIESFIEPFLNKLKNANAGRRQSSRLIEILENNLQQLVKSYGVNESLPATLLKLTGVEKQVASMIRQGLSTKVIAATLNSTSGTINIHRKNIRKKLGLSNKGINLQNHLKSLSS